MKKSIKMKKAFTLVEMMIVVIIIGILMGALLPKLKWAQASARDVARKANLSTISSALEMEFNDQWIYPTWSCMNDSGVKSALVPTYINTIPSDPQKGRLVYWTKKNWCDRWVYAYSNLTKDWADHWWSVLVANLERVWKNPNWVLTWSKDYKTKYEFTWATEYVWNLDNKVCSDWVIKTGSTNVQCSSSSKQWAVKDNGAMVYAVFN